MAIGSLAIFLANVAYHSHMPGVTVSAAGSAMKKPKHSMMTKPTTHPKLEKMCVP